MRIRTIVAVLAILLFCPAFENSGATQAASDKKDVAAEVDALKVQVALLAHQAQNSKATSPSPISSAPTATMSTNASGTKPPISSPRMARSKSVCAACGSGQDHVRTYLHTLPELKYGTLFNHMQLQPVIDVAPDGKTAKARWRAFEQFGALHRSAQWAEGTCRTST